MTANDLIQYLQEAWCDQSYLPPVPGDAALRLMELGHTPQTPETLLKAMRRDPLLTLHAWGHAARTYSAGDPPQDLPGVASRLGSYGAAEVTQRLVNNVGQVSDDSYAKAMEAVRVHSLRVARLSRRIAETAAHNAHRAYAAGLLSDVGLLACLAAMSEAPEPPDLAQAWNEVMELHADTTRFVLQCVGLPEKLAWDLADHHGIDGSGAESDIGAVVLLAERAAADSETTALPFSQRRSLYVPDDTQVQRARNRLGLDEARWRGLVEAA